MDIIETIVNEWDIKTLPILLFQLDRDVYEVIEKKVNYKLKKKQPIFVNLLLAFTKKYNDKVYEKYGARVLLEGLENIITYIGDYEADGFIRNSLLEGELDKIPKGSMSKRNILKILKEVEI